MKMLIMFLVKKVVTWVRYTIITIDIYIYIFFAFSGLEKGYFFLLHSKCTSDFSFLMVSTVFCLRKRVQQQKKKKKGKEEGK